MVDVALISGIIIIAVAVITLIRIIKPLLEGIVVIVLVVIGSALIFHSAPLIGLPNFHIPISEGPNIVGVNAGVDNTTDIAVFNAYPIPIGSFSVSVGGKKAGVLNSALAIGGFKFGVVVINSTRHGTVVLNSSSQFLGFSLGGLSTQYNYT
ncbi:MAG: hypothetical protein QW292_01175 [Candidatus Parvarchaeota archaeon]